MRKLLFLLVIINSSILFSQNPIAETPKIVIKVPLGETIQLANVSINLIEVLEDSRCPTYLNCVWAGRARVLVEIIENQNEPFQKVLLFGEILSGETKDNVLFTTEDNIISGYDLFPLPSSKLDEERGPFELLIYVESK